MADAVELVKRAAVDAVEAGKPVRVVLGTVISASPLKIQSEQKSVYTEKMLILPQSLTDRTLTLTEEDTAPPRTRRVTVHNALQAGERVALLRVQGGKGFLVLERVGGTK